MFRVFGHLALAVLPLFAGCATEAIYSEYPLGEDFAIVKPEEWAGVWVEDGGIDRRWFVTDSGKGMIARNSDSTLCELGPTEDPVRLRRFGPWYFARKKEGPDGGNLYATESAQFRDENALLTYQIDVPRVRDLVEEGVLPGRLEGGKVILGKLTPVHYKILLLPEGPAFRWKPSKVEMMLPTHLDPCKKPTAAK